MNVTYLENDAMELILRDRHRPIRLLLLPARQPFHPPRIQQRHPLCLSRLSPVQTHKQDAIRVINTRIASIREQNRLERSVRRERHRVTALKALVALHVFNRVCELGATVGTDGAVADNEYVVAPACACDDWCVFLPVDAQCDAEEGVDADVAGVGACYDVGVTQGDADGVLAGRESGAPVSAGGPRFVGAVV